MEDKCNDYICLKHGNIGIDVIGNLCKIVNGNYKH